MFCFCVSDVALGRAVGTVPAQKEVGRAAAQLRAGSRSHSSLSMPEAGAGAGSRGCRSSIRPPWLPAVLCTLQAQAQ